MNYRWSAIFVEDMVTAKWWEVQVEVVVLIGQLFVQWVMLQIVLRIFIILATVLERTLS